MELKIRTSCESKPPSPSSSSSPPHHFAISRIQCHIRSPTPIPISLTSNSNGSPTSHCHGLIQHTSEDSRSPSSYIPQNFASPNSGRRLGSGLVCVVCGDTSSGKHYGILACNGCSGFFKRSVRRKLIYRCQAGTGTCVVDKAHRNQCQACRLKKCLQMGMNKDAVQNERQPRNTATLRPEALCEMDQERALREAAVAVGVFGPLLGSRAPGVLSVSGGGHVHLGGGVVGSSFHHPQPPPIVSSQSNESNACRDNDDEDSIDVTSDDNLVHRKTPPTSLTQNGNNGTTIHGNAAVAFGLSTPTTGPNTSIEIPSALYNPAHETIYETSARLLFMAVKWAKNLPSFGSLPFRDQVILLEEAWADLFLLNAIQWCMPSDAVSLFSAADHLSQLPNGKAVQVAGDLRTLNDALIRFRGIGVDPAEFACLKAITLFKSDTRGLKDPLQVENLQDQAQVMLCQHSRSQHPSQPAREL